MMGTEITEHEGRYSTLCLEPVTIASWTKNTSGQRPQHPLVTSTFVPTHTSRLRPAHLETWDHI